LPTRFAPFLLLMPLVACADRYTPDTYATRAVQQANKVEQGVIAGVRKVNISAEGSTGAAAGAAAGGVLGAQTPGGGIGAALGGVGGALVGGLIGRATESAAVDAPAFEYVVRTLKGELVSVTQRDEKALAIGLKVLVITGNQARVVPDYTVPPPSNPQVAVKPEAREQPEIPGPAQATEAGNSAPAADPATKATTDMLRQMAPAPPAPPVLVPQPKAPTPLGTLSTPPAAAAVAAALGAQ
jgi:outer membrane lipoprotein SlyB